MSMRQIMQMLKHSSWFRGFQLNLIGASLKVIPNGPTHSAVLVRALLLWLPVAACLQTSVATGNLSMGGNRNEAFEGEPSSPGKGESPRQTVPSLTGCGRAGGTHPHLSPEFTAGSVQSVTK